MQIFKLNHLQKLSKHKQVQMKPLLTEIGEQWYQYKKIRSIKMSLLLSTEGEREM